MEITNIALIDIDDDLYAWLDMEWSHRQELTLGPIQYTGTGREAVCVDVELCIGMADHEVESYPHARRTAEFQRFVGMMKYLRGLGYTMALLQAQTQEAAE